MPLQVLDHEILSGKLVMVSVVIYSLMRLQMEVVENIIDLISFDPKDIPLVSFHLLVAPFPEGFKHTVPKAGLEFDLRKVGRIVLFLDILPEVFRHLWDDIYFK